MRATVFIYLARIIFGKEAFEMLVRLYAGEIILGKSSLKMCRRAFISVSTNTW